MGITSYERLIISKCCEALLPGSSHMPISGHEAGAVTNFISFLEKSPWLFRNGFRLIIQFIQFSPFLYKKNTVFTRLNRLERVELLTKISNNSNYSIRMAILGLRTGLVLGYFNSDKVLNHLGITPNKDPFKKK